MRIDFTSVESMRPSILAAVAALVLAATAPALAREAVLPLQVDNAFLLRLLEEQVFTDPEGSANVWQDEAGCSEIVLREPDVGSAAALVRVSSRFSAKLGAGLGNWCVGVTHWTGRVDVLMEPSVHPSMPIVTFRVVDSHLYNDAGEKTFTGTVWDWFKARVHPRLETVRVDLYGPVTELELFLPLILGGTDVERTQALIDSLRIRAVEPTPSGLRIDVGLSVPESPPDAVGPPAPVPTLTAEEVDRWQRTLDSWDGFLTFIVKRAGRDAQTVELQRVLGEILLEARYDLVEALRPTQMRDDDPVRPLFLKTWKRLAPALREASLGVPGESAVRYLSLLTAGDALTALDELGPGFGWQVSSDGLRRLARMVGPVATDPTRRSEDAAASWASATRYRSRRRPTCPMIGPIRRIRRIRRTTRTNRTNRRRRRSAGSSGRRPTRPSPSTHWRGYAPGCRSATTCTTTSPPSAGCCAKRRIRRARRRRSTAAGIRCSST